MPIPWGGRIRKRVRQEYKLNIEIENTTNVLFERYIKKLYIFFYAHVIKQLSVKRFSYIDDNDIVSPQQT